MLADSPTPRRKRRFLRWLLVIFVLLFAWAGWRAYAFRSALAKAKELGWRVDYTSPSDVIRQDWKAAFDKDTWLDGVIYVGIPVGAKYEPHFPILHRLNPSEFTIFDASILHDLSALRSLSRLKVLGLGQCTKLTDVDALEHFPDLAHLDLFDSTGLTNVDALKYLNSLEWVDLTGCTGLRNVDVLKHLPYLQEVRLNGCKGLTSVDALKHHRTLKFVDLTGCIGLTKESIADLKAALPNATIFHD